ncbi:DUF305 domain-containing protein [Paenibacillus sp. sgz5001063]|uniref:DUF305 domain-containing protein n=1 Tax=Paenibacillus sp. sgz5001063 TaxID=3242474 RepID=UPI0036D3004A
MKMYVRFGMMIIISTLLMYWLMYLNVFQIDHIYFSQTRLYMALIMGSAMAIVMLLFMWKMYTKRIVNALILTINIVVFGLSLWLVRSQTTVGDVAWMKAMIPHHSIAILTSERANISDPRVRKIADGIIESQKREIAEMKELINQLEKDQ